MPRWSRLLVYGITPAFFLTCGDSNPVATPQVVLRIEVRAASSVTVIGGTFPVTATVVAQDGSLIVDRAVEWSTSNAAIAVVTSTGNLTGSVEGKGVGPVTISARLDGKSGFVTLTGTGPAPPAPLPAQAFLWSEAEGFTLIPRLSGATTNAATALNATAGVVGYSRRDNQDRPFIWTRARGLTELGLLPGATSCYASGVNDGEVVVGTCSFSPNPSRAFRWTAATGMYELALPPGTVGSDASGINNAGEISGATLLVSGTKPARWNSAGAHEALSIPEGPTQGSAVAINDAGTAVGWTVPNSDYYAPVSGVLWRRGSGADVFDPCTTSGCYAYPQAISQNGRVTGTRQGKAFTWSQATGFTDIAGSLGTNYSVGVGINDSGQAAVTSYPTGTSRGSLVSAAGTARDIGLLPGYSRMELAGLNNSGQVVGTAR